MLQLFGVTLWLFTLSLAGLFALQQAMCDGEATRCFREGGMLSQASQGAVALLPETSLRNTATGAGGLAAQLLVLFGGGGTTLGSLGGIFGVGTLRGRPSLAHVSFPDLASRLTVVTATLTGHLGVVLREGLGIVAASWWLVVAEIGFLLGFHLLLRWLRFYLDGAMRTWAIWWGYYSRARAQDGEIPMARIEVHDTTTVHS